MTPTARKTLEAVMAYAKDTHGEPATLTFQEVATAIAAPVRVQKALKAAHEKSVVFFVCRSHEIYDAAVQQLCVQWQRSFKGDGGGGN